MARKKAPDKLTRDSSAAIAMGISYGKYMAMKPPEKPKPVPPKKGITRTCEYCGCEFTQYDNRERRYCCEEHRLSMDSRRQWQKRKAAQMA